MLARYGHLEHIPPTPASGTCPASGAPRSWPRRLRENLELAVLFRHIATVVTDPAVIDVGTVDSWRWAGPTAEFAAVAARLEAPELVGRAVALANRARRP